MPAVRRTALVLLCLALPACGNDRTPPPDVAAAAPQADSAPVRLPAAGVTLTAPRGWRVDTRGPAPLLAQLTSGRASIALFRYPRTEPLPRTAAELDEAAAALVDAAGQRDASFEAADRRRTRVDGRPAVVVRGTGTVGGQPRTVRSTHVYAFGGELVVDALAPAADFERLDAGAFRELVRSLRLRPPAA